MRYNMPTLNKLIYIYHLQLFAECCAAGYLGGIAVLG